MRALTVPTPGAKAIDQLAWQDVPLPEPAATQVLIEVKAVGLNPADVKSVTHGFPGWAYPHILGLDAAGVITAVGSAVTAFQPGDRVATHGDLAQNGCFAAAVLADEKAVARLPLGVDFVTAAGSLCAGVTAYQALAYKANLSAVQTVLVHAGAGGVGSMAIQLAKRANKRVFTTVSPAKRAFAERLAPDTIIDYQHEDVTARLMALTNGHGVDLIVNTIGHADDDLPRLAFNGQLICLLAGPQQVDPGRAQSVAWVNLGGAHRSGDPRQVATLGRMIAELLKLVAAHAVDPMITKQLPFADLPAGLALVAEGTQPGKIVAVAPTP